MTLYIQAHNAYISTVSSIDANVKAHNQKRRSMGLPYAARFMNMGQHYTLYVLVYGYANATMLERREKSDVTESHCIVIRNIPEPESL